MTALLLIVPLTGIYPFFVMQALVLCAAGLRLQSADRLWRPVVVRPRDVPGHRRLRQRARAEGLGAVARTRHRGRHRWLPPGLPSITGLIAIRRQGIYFAMITLALSQLLYFIYLQTPFTHGEDGIQGIPQGYLFGVFDLSKPTTLYYVILAGFLFGFLLIYRTINSPFGEVLKSIRENEQRAISLGYKTDQYKLLAYILSGTLAGFAGSLKVFVAQNASLTDVHWTHVRRNRADDAGRRSGHGVRPGGRRLRHHRHAAISGRFRAVGAR